jgi:hypothetical protein
LLTFSELHAREAKDSGGKPWLPLRRHPRLELPKEWEVSWRCEGGTGEELAEFGPAMPHIVEARLAGVRLSAAAAEALARLQPLQTLMAEDCELPPEFHAALGKLQNLTLLKLNGCGTRDAEAAELVQCTSLRALELRDSRLTDEDWRYWRGFRRCSGWDVTRSAVSARAAQVFRERHPGVEVIGWWPQES